MNVGLYPGNSASIQNDRDDAPQGGPVQRPCAVKAQQYSPPFLDPSGFEIKKIQNTNTKMQQIMYLKQQQEWNHQGIGRSFVNYAASALIWDTWLPITGYSPASQSVVYASERAGIAYVGSLCVKRPYNKFTTGAGFTDGSASPHKLALFDGRLVTMDGKLYDPAKNTTAMVQSAPTIFTAQVQLLDGRVMVMGGGTNWSGNILNTYKTISNACYILPLDNSNLIPLASMIIPRAEFAAVLLPDGRVMVAGGVATKTDGVNATMASHCEIYNPKLNTWTLVAPMANAVATTYNTMFLLPTGDVLFTGGRTLDGYAFMGPYQLYNPITNKWGYSEIPVIRGPVFVDRMEIFYTINFAQKFTITTRENTDTAKPKQNEYTFFYNIHDALVLPRGWVKTTDRNGIPIILKMR